MDFQNLFSAPPEADGSRSAGQSKKFKWLAIGLAAFIVLLLVFQAGVFVGFRKARFSYAWGDNYHRMFGGPKGGFLRDFQGADFISGHGTTGTIAKIDANTLIIKGQDGAEKTVTVEDNTSIKKGAEDIKITDLKVDERIVVIGNPKDDGSIVAEIIRVFDPNQIPSPPPGFRLPWPR